MEKIILTIEQWLQMKENGENVNVPVWFQVTGNSMFPFIRAFKDEVMITSLPKDEYKVGDIVLFPAKRMGGDHCLHRIFKIDGDMVQTLGDGCRYPDAWISKDALLGKGILIKRGDKTIDCEAPRWVRIFKVWNLFRGIRPVMLFPFKVVRYLKRKGFVKEP